MEQTDTKPKKDVVTIVDSSDDDCIVLSHDDEVPEEDDDPQNSGLHVNDTYNVPDDQGRVVINIGHPEGEPDIYLAPQIARVIKPHQIGGVRFLFDNIIESMERFSTSSGSGCILAHSMGLGKTLQLVCFCDIFLRHTNSKTILCIMPINTLQNWMAEFNMWLPDDPEKSPMKSSGEVRGRNFNLYVLNDTHKTLNARSKVVLEWAEKGGVLLMGYELYRLLSMKKAAKKRGRKVYRDPEVEKEEAEKHKKLLDEIQTALVNPGPDLVVCDEGHRIRNPFSALLVALKQILSKRRIVLTGYPLQNNLLEYWCMVNFVRPNYLGTKTQFTNMFERPIQNGQCIDSTPEDTKLMRERAHVLHSLLLGFVQRRSHVVLQNSLPQKEEYVLLVRMTPFQRNLYEVFMNEVVRVKAVPNPLKAFAVCCKIWNHPDVLYNFLKKREADLDLEEAEAATNDPTYVPPIGLINESSKNARPESSQPKNRKSEAKNMPLQIVEMKLEASNSLDTVKDETKTKIEEKDPKSKDDGIPYDWAIELMKNYVPDLIENSPKMEIFFCILKESLRLGDRMLVFSQSLLTLNLIEKFLQANTVNNTDIKWAKNLNYYRLDGSTAAQEREKLINEFNCNPNVHLFLVSTRAGSLGINLVGANRVVVFDASWNPCHDTQAVCRVYRYGQKKQCFVYRLVMDSCLEKKIYDRQVNKQGMSDRVVDKSNPDAHLSLKEVTSLCWDGEKETEVKDFSESKDKYTDVAMRKIMEKFSKRMSKEPFQHESLLIDRKEKKLSMAEKQLAQIGYELKKQAAISPNCDKPGSGMHYSPMRTDGAIVHRPVASVPPSSEGDRMNGSSPYGRGARIPYSNHTNLGLSHGSSHGSNRAMSQHHHYYNQYVSPQHSNHEQRQHALYPPSNQNYNYSSPMSTLNSAAVSPSISYLLPAPQQHMPSMYYQGPNDQPPGGYAPQPYHQYNMGYPPYQPPPMQNAVPPGPYPSQPPYDPNYAQPPPAQPLNTYHKVEEVAQQPCNPQHPASSNQQPNPQQQNLSNAYNPPQSQPPHTSYTQGGTNPPYQQHHNPQQQYQQPYYHQPPPSNYPPPSGYNNYPAPPYENFGPPQAPPEPQPVPNQYPPIQPQYPLQPSLQSPVGNDQQQYGGYPGNYNYPPYNNNHSGQWQYT